MSSLPSWLTSPLAFSNQPMSTAPIAPLMRNATGSTITRITAMTIAPATAELCPDPGPRLDLDCGAEREGGNREGRPGWAVVSERRHVRLVHHREVRDVGQEHRRLDDTCQRRPFP